ncbi:HYC_CC_PP family protein [Alkalitalea saponilacus]|nr:hypothetical protein [Alkalitalea saponilacus]
MQKIKAISSALLILLFSMSIGGAWHYCGGTPVNFNLTLQNSQPGCAMAGCNILQDSDDAMLSYGNNCCKNIYQQLETDNYQISDKPRISCAEIVVFYSLYAEYNFISSENENIHSYFYKHPPDFLYEVDLNIVQTYLL